MRCLNKSGYRLTYNRYPLESVEVSRGNTVTHSPLLLYQRLTAPNDGQQSQPSLPLTGSTLFTKPPLITAPVNFTELLTDFSLKILRGIHERIR